MHKQYSSFRSLLEIGVCLLVLVTHSACGTRTNSGKGKSTPSAEDLNKDLDLQTPPPSPQALVERIEKMDVETRAKELATKLPSDSSVTKEEIQKKLTDLNNDLIAIFKGEQNENVEKKTLEAAISYGYDLDIIRGLVENKGAKIDISTLSAVLDHENSQVFGCQPKVLEYLIKKVGDEEKQELVEDLFSGSSKNPERFEKYLNWILAQPNLAEQLAKHLLYKVLYSGILDSDFEKLKQLIEYASGEDIKSIETSEQGFSTLQKVIENRKLDDAQIKELVIMLCAKDANVNKKVGEYYENLLFYFSSLWYKASENVKKFKTEISACTALLQVKSSLTVDSIWLGDLLDNANTLKNNDQHELSKSVMKFAGLMIKKKVTKDQADIKTWLKIAESRSTNFTKKEFEPIRKAFEGKEVECSFKYEQ